MKITKSIFKSVPFLILLLTACGGDSPPPVEPADEPQDETDVGGANSKVEPNKVFIKLPLEYQSQAGIVFISGSSRLGSSKKPVFLSYKPASQSYIFVPVNIGISEVLYWQGVNSSLPKPIMAKKGTTYFGTLP